MRTPRRTRGARCPLQRTQEGDQIALFVGVALSDTPPRAKPRAGDAVELGVERGKKILGCGSRRIVTFFATDDALSMVR